MRLRTLPLSVAGVILGSMMAAGAGFCDWQLIALALVTTLSLQILANVANEVGDLNKGTDNDYRLGPIRSAQSGALTANEMKGTIVVFGAIAVVAGSVLVYRAFGDFLDIKSLLLLFTGALAIIAAVKYTIGRHAYGYRGLGDFFVFLFFGLVSVAGTYFLMTGTLSGMEALPAAAIGCFSVGVLNLNNIRDIENDRACGKRTVPVLLGLRGAKIYHFILILAGILAVVVYTGVEVAGVTDFLYLLTLPLFAIHLSQVSREEGKALDPQLRWLSITTLLFALLLGLGEVL